MVNNTTGGLTSSISIDSNGGLYISYYDDANSDLIYASQTIQYTITASAGANGSISPSGSVSVNQNGSQIFTISPNANFSVADVLVDGSSVGSSYPVYV